jgi:hypothetical protein
MKSPNPHGPFNWRSFASLMLFLGFLVMLVSGSILYISPRGRTANWSGWGILGLGKEEWASVHITAAILLILVACLHLFFNWSIFFNYLKSRRTSGFHLRKELFASLVVTVACFFGTVWDLPPFGTVVAFSGSMKDYWERNTSAAPVAHAEELSLAKVAEQAKIEPEELAARLRAAGYSLPDIQVPFKEIARLNQVTPNKLYEAASIPAPRGPGGRGQGNRGQHAGGGGGGRGYGRMTLGELCIQESIALDQAISRLSGRGITATEDQSVRDLADQLNINPYEVLPVLKGETESVNEG